MLGYTRYCLENVRHKLSEINNCVAVWNFNLGLSPDKDYFSYWHLYHPEGKQKNIKLLLDLDWIKWEMITSKEENTQG